MAPTAIRLARRGVDGAFSDVPWIRLIGIALSCRFISLGSVCGDWSRHESTSSPARISERDIGHLPYHQCCAPKPDGCGFPWFRLVAGASIDSGCHASPREVACHPDCFLLFSWAAQTTVSAGQSGRLSAAGLRPCRSAGAITATPQRSGSGRPARADSAIASTSQTLCVPGRGACKPPAG